MTGKSRRLAWVTMLTAAFGVALPIQNGSAEEARSANRSAAGAASQRGSLRATLVEPDAYVMREAAPSPGDAEGDSETSDDPLQTSDADGRSQSPAQDPDAAPQDGDLSIAPDAISTEGSRSAIDGPVPTSGEATNLERDTRPDEDLAVFEQPKAGFDARLFQIEDIDTESDRRPSQLARLEPYDPVGFRIGSFVLFPEANFSQTVTDNVTSSNTPARDSFQSIKTETRLVSKWQRHALELRGTTDTSFHDNYELEDVRAYLLEARGRLDFTSRTNLQVIASTAVSQEKRTGIDANRSGDNADITTEQVSAALSHRFNRLTVKLKSSVMDYSVGPANGVSNASRDYVETTQGLRGTYDVTDRVGAFVDVQAVQRDHETTDANRDTPGKRWRVGLDFGKTSKSLQGEVSVGYGTQRARDARLGDRQAFLFDTNLAWRPTGLTSFLFTAVSDIADTTSGPIAGVISRQLGVEARHAFRNYLVASAGLTYTAYDYGSSSGEEHGLTASLGAEYTLNPEVMLSARAEHTTFDGNTAVRSFDENNVRIGVRVRR